MDLRPRTHINATSRLIEEKDSRLSRMPSSEHDFLLVSSTQRANGLLHGSGPYMHRFHDFLNLEFLLPSTNPAPAGKTGKNCHAGVSPNGMPPKDPLHQAVFREISNPCLHGLTGRLNMEKLTIN